MASGKSRLDYWVDTIEGSVWRVAGGQGIIIWSSSPENFPWEAEARGLLDKVQFGIHPRACIVMCAAVTTILFIEIDYATCWLLDCWKGKVIARWNGTQVENQLNTGSKCETNSEIISTGLTLRTNPPLVSRCWCRVSDHGVVRPKCKLEFMLWVQVAAWEIQPLNLSIKWRELIYLQLIWFTS